MLGCAESDRRGCSRTICKKREQRSTRSSARRSRRTRPRFRPTIARARAARARRDESGQEGGPPPQARRACPGDQSVQIPATWGYRAREAPADCASSRYRFTRSRNAGINDVVGGIRGRAQIKTHDAHFAPDAYIRVHSAAVRCAAASSRFHASATPLSNGSSGPGAAQQRLDRQ